MRLETRIVAVVVVGLLGSAPGTSRPAIAETPTSDKCAGKLNGKVTIKFALQGTACAAVQPVDFVCVKQGNEIHWTLTNDNCSFTPGSDAVVISQPEPQAGQPKFTYETCTPKKPAWPAGSSVQLNCKVPATAREGRYKYTLSGQITTLDPDIEVRRR